MTRLRFFALGLALLSGGCHSARNILEVTTVGPPGTVKMADARSGVESAPDGGPGPAGEGPDAKAPAEGAHDAADGPAAAPSDGDFLGDAANPSPPAPPTGWSDRTGDWLRIAWPQGGSRPAMVYDSARKRMVLFPGSETGPFSVWEWDGASWADRTPNPPDSLPPGVVWPSSRIGMSVAYDVDRQVTLVFGGDSPDGPLAELYEWNGVGFRQLATAPAPPPQTRHTMAYDSVRKVMVVLFCGYDPDSEIEKRELWEWSGATWSNRTPSPLPPGDWPTQCQDSSMIWDDREGRIVIFGGSSNIRSEPSREVWAWDGSRFIDLTPLPRPAGWPRGTSGHTAAFDSTRGLMLVFGGIVSDIEPPPPDPTDRFANLWEWHPTAWRFADRKSRAAAVGTWPADRSGAAGAFDPDRGVLVIFGGYTSFGNTRELWEWNPSASETYRNSPVQPR